MDCDLKSLELNYMPYVKISKIATTKSPFSWIQERPIKRKKKLTEQWGMTTLFATNEAEGKAGIALLSRYPVQNFTSVERDPEGRYLVTELKIHKSTFLIIAIYAPVDSVTARKNFFDKINGVIASKRRDDHTTILLGDFNMTMQPSVDKRDNNVREGSTENLTELLHNHGLEDSWRQRNPNKREYTYVSNHGHPSRIDRVYTSRTHRALVTETGIEPFPLSDHSLIHVALETGDVDIGPGKLGNEPNPPGRRCLLRKNKYPMD